MPQVSHFGSMAARGFGFTLPGGGGPVIDPYIVRVTTPSTLYASILMTDGSMLALAGGYPYGDFTILAKNTHSPGASKRLNKYIDYYQTQNPASNDEGTLAYVEAFARVDETNTLLQTRETMNSFFWGGNPGATASYDPVSGSTFLTSSLYADGSSSATTPHIRRTSSSGTLQANYNFCTDPNYDTTATTVASAVNNSYVFVVTADYYINNPVIWRFDKTSTLSSGTAFIPSGFTSDTSGVSSIATDAANNIYFSARDSTNGGTTLFKYNSSMSSKLASVRISGYYPVSFSSSVAVDPVTGDVYWVIGTSSTNALILKTNSSLTPQFARQISINVTGGPFRDMQIVGSAMAFRNQDSGYAFVLPKDGSKTGSYSVGGGTVTYSSLSLPSYATVSAGWTTTTGYYTTRSFTTTTPTESTGTSFSVSSLNI